MPYILNSPLQIEEMLKIVGVSSVEDLFSHLPSQIRMKGDLDFPRGLSEDNLKKTFSVFAKKNTSLSCYNSFLGAGCYIHYLPSALNAIISRSEFYTAYTPYQPECSQGTLQAIYEFQSYICLLTGMDAANASLYDGATSLAEAVLMSLRINKKKKVFVSGGVHPEYRNVLTTYLSGFEYEIKEIPFSSEGSVDRAFLREQIDEFTSCAVIQNPNFFGVIEDISGVVDYLKQRGIMVICVNNPFSLALLKDPASLGTDIVCGDTQAFGAPLSFGGPGCGFLAVPQKYVRQLPGRIVGKTTDKKGNTGYCLTLQAREQHIRREHATSNICSNQSLNALSCAVYLSLLGEEGLRKNAVYSLNLTHYLFERLHQVKGVSFPFSGVFFNEFVWRIGNASGVLKNLYRQKCIAGLELERFYPELKNHILSCCTETKTKEEIDEFVELLKDAVI